MEIDKRILVVIVISAVFIVAIIAARRMFTQSATATAILRVERPPQMPIEEFEDYRNSQRRMILSEYVLSEAAEDPLVARTRFISNRKDSTKALADGLKDISQPDPSELIVLTFECPDRKEAKTILNEIIDEYMTKIVVEARVQREGLLAGVKETHQFIAKNCERLNQVREVLAEVANSQLDGQTIRLADCQRELATEKSQSQDAARTERLERTISYIDKRLSRETNAEQDLFVGAEIEKLDRDLQRHQTRLGQIGNDIAEWDSYPVPEIKVIQHAEIMAGRK